MEALLATRAIDCPTLPSGRARVPIDRAVAAVATLRARGVRVEAVKVDDPWEVMGVNSKRELAALVNSDREARAALYTNEGRPRQKIDAPGVAEALALLDTYRAQIEQCEKLKVELDLIHDAITRTKREIATLHGKSFNGEEMAKVNGELGAVVGGTEEATQQILEAAEAIDGAEQDEEVARLEPRRAVVDRHRGDQQRQPAEPHQEQELLHELAPVRERGSQSGDDRLAREDHHVPDLLE